jgi:hypothetical protein
MRQRVGTCQQYLPSGYSVSSPQKGPIFGAFLVGHTYPKAAHQAITLVQIDPHNPRDHQWVNRMRIITSQQSAQTSLMPDHAGCKPSIGWKQIKTTWQRAHEALQQWAVEPPIVLLALNTAQAVVGVCLGHAERWKGNLQRQYTSFPQAQVTALHQPATHSQIEKLYNNSPLPGVGKALLTAYEQQLPESVAHVTICSLHPSLSPKASQLYTAMGFVSQPHVLNEPKLEPGMASSACKPVTFRRVLTTPMAVTRAELAKHAHHHAEKALYKATHDAFSLENIPLFNPHQPTTQGH